MTINKIDATQMSKVPASDIKQIRVIAIAETQQQRLAFSDTVNSMGLTLLYCLAPEEINKQHLSTKADIWLVDSQYDNELYQKLNETDNEVNEGEDTHKTILIGFSKAPYLNEIQPYGKWQRQLKRKLADILNLPQLHSTVKYRPNIQQWRFVVFLGASMGGPAAIKTFLDHLSPDLPITLLLAQHFNEHMIDTLPRILNRHNRWRCQVISTSQIMQSGQCLIAPISHKVVCDSTGRIILTEEAWQGRYKPCIGDMLKNASDAFGDELISIIFSGMGSDGSQYVDTIAENNSQLWVQDPNSSTCASQPQSMIDTRQVDFIGTPEALAAQLTAYVKQHVSD